MQGSGGIARAFLDVFQSLRRLVGAKPGFQILPGKVSIQCAGLDGVSGAFAVPVFDDQASAVGFDLHAALRQSRMQILPGGCRVQRTHYLFMVLFGVGVKGLLAGVRLHQTGFLVPALTGLLR